MLEIPALWFACQVKLETAEMEGQAGLLEAFEIQMSLQAPDTILGVAGFAVWSAGFRSCSDLILHTMVYSSPSK